MIREDSSGLKIAYVTGENIDPDGNSGASAHIRENIRNLRKAGHVVNLISCYSEPGIDSSKAGDLRNVADHGVRERVRNADTEVSQTLTRAAGSLRTFVRNGKGSVSRPVSGDKLKYGVNGGINLVQKTERTGSMQPGPGAGEDRSVKTRPLNKENGIPHTHCRTNGRVASDRPGLIRKIYRNWTPVIVKRLVAAIKIKNQNRQLFNRFRQIVDECDIIYERDAFHNFEILRYRKKRDIPWLIECNGFFWGDMISDFHRPVVERFYRRRHLKKWQQADHLIAVSGRFKDKMVEDGIPEHRISVIHNGVDLAAHEKVTVSDVRRIREKLELDNGIVIGFLGSMLPWHRIDMLIEAIERLNRQGYPVKGLIVGGGIWKDYLEAGEKKGLTDNIIFTGPVEPDRVPVMVAAMDICTLPGSTDYNSPVKLFDYGAAGKPVVAADFEAVTEVITHRENGLLFRRNRVDAFIQCLKSLLDDADLRQKLGSRLYEKVKTDHSWEKIAEKTAGILSQVYSRSVKKPTENTRIQSF